MLTAGADGEKRPSSSSSLRERISVDVVWPQASFTDFRRPSLISTERQSPKNNRSAAARAGDLRVRLLGAFSLTWPRANSAGSRQIAITRPAYRVLTTSLDCL